MSLLRDMKLMSRDKSVDLTGVFSAIIFSAYDKFLTRMWRHKPDLFLFIHSWNWRSMKQACSRYIVSSFTHDPLRNYLKQIVWNGARCIYFMYSLISDVLSIADVHDDRTVV